MYRLRVVAVVLYRVGVRTPVAAAASVALESVVAVLVVTAGADVVRAEFLPGFVHQESRVVVYPFLYQVFY